MYYIPDIPFVKTEEESQEESSKKCSGRGQMSSFLPPCRICGDKASGFHYGANTCEACKGFFRRSIVRGQKNEDFEYRCVNGKKCILTTGKLRLCAYCRYKKCLAIGMSKRAIKQGRYTHERRTQYINEVKSKHDTCDIKQDNFPGQCVSEETNEVVHLVNTLMAIQQKHTSQKYICDINHNNTAAITYPDGEDTKILRNIVDTFETSVILMVEFMKCIPDFTQLHFHDQSELLKVDKAPKTSFLSAKDSILTIVHSDFFLLGEINTPLFEHRQQNQMPHLYKSPVHHLYSVSKLQDVYRFMEKAKQLRITIEEACLLRAIAVLSTDRVDLFEPYKVEQMQWYCVNCLRQLVACCHSNPNQRLWQLLDRITTLRTLCPDY